MEVSHTWGMTLFDEFHGWLNRRFPESKTDDGYSFFILKAPFLQQVEGGKGQVIIDELTKGRWWLWVVGADPRPYVAHTRAESEAIIYNPDWNVWEEIPQWLLEGTDTKIDVAQIARQLEGPDLFVVINPDRGVVLHLGHLALGSDTQEGLQAVVESCPGCFRGAE